MRAAVAPSKKPFGRRKQVKVLSDYILVRFCNKKIFKNFGAVVPGTITHRMGDVPVVQCVHGRTGANA